ncbi:MAG: Fe-S cluster assembly ATPase SufC [Anaeroplasmataceae bacterium]
MAKTLEIINLHAKTLDGQEILKGLSLKINTNEVHVIMGPNGTGKSTLLNIIMGKQSYIIEQGDILLDGKSILSMPVDERARAGIFLAYQYPSEVSGVTNSDFIRSSMKACGNDMNLFKFIKEYDKACHDLKMPEGLAHRYLNEGFSGGEKKRNEILQMKMLKPSFGLLDEIDSGLDVDALRIVGENVNSLVSEDFGCLLVTHYERLLDYIKPDFVHVMINGKIVKSGKRQLIDKIDKEGYDWVKKELGIDIVSSDIKKERVHSLGSCANNLKK